MKTNKWILLLLTGILFTADLSAMESNPQYDNVTLDEENEYLVPEKEDADNPMVKIARKGKKTKSKKVSSSLFRTSQSAPVSSGSDTEDSGHEKISKSSENKKGRNFFRVSTNKSRFRSNSTNKNKNTDQDQLIVEEKDLTKKMFNALKSGNTELIIKLLNKGTIDLTQKNDNDETVADFARTKGFHLLAKALENRTLQIPSEEEIAAIKKEIKTVLTNLFSDRTKNFH